MKKAAIIPAMTLFLAMLASCGLFDFNLKEYDDSHNLPDTLEDGFFYAQNIATRKFYTLEAKMLYEDEKCEIWAETGSEVTAAKAREIAFEYNNKIRQIIVDTFGSDDIDILDFANRLVGRDNGKLTILLLDIKDKYKNPETDTYVAGYFYAGNFLRKGKNISGGNIYYSNGRDMIYLDTNPGLKNYSAQVYETFAHELQHLVNFATTVLIDREHSMETWIDEGLSAYAEYLYLGKNPEDKCAWLSDNRNTVMTGNNFFVWDNYKDKPAAIMDDYATVYLFFRWLYLQADANLQSRIFREIIHSPHNDYRAVTSVVDKDWEFLLKTWFAANHDPKNAVYGYKGDLYLQEGAGSIYTFYKGVRVTPIGGSTRSLYPGEGVYSIINGPYPTGGGTNIRHEELNNYLLTFNANANNEAGREIGTLTGVPVPSASQTTADSARSAERTRPFVIDAQDLLGRNQDAPIRLLPR
jgi:hypothetical protein